MKLATKLAISMGLLVALLIGLGAFCLIQMDGINQTATEIADGWLPRVILAEEMNTDASDFRVQQLQHVIAQSPANMEQREKELQRLRQSFEDKAQRLEKAIVLPAGKKLFGELMSMWADYMRLADQITAVSRENRIDDAMALLDGEAAESYDAMSDKLLALVKLNTDGTAEANEQADLA